MKTMGETENARANVFQKAFDLSGSEIVAAERLARSYADQADWDLVEIIAQRVVDSGKARPAPGFEKERHQLAILCPWGGSDEQARLPASNRVVPCCATD